MKAKITWPIRKQIEELCRNKVTICDISKIIGVSHQTAYKEIRAGLSSENYKLRNYYLYSAELAHTTAKVNAVKNVRKDERSLSVITWPIRKQIEELCKNKVTVSDISQSIKISRQVIYADLRRGLSAEDYKKHKFYLYSADLAQAATEAKAVNRIK